MAKSRKKKTTSVPKWPKPKWPKPNKIYTCDGWAAKIRDLRGFLPLSEQAMHYVGSAAQTLGALYLVVNSETRTTFRSVPNLVPYACIPARTIRGHLDVLEERGWVINHGRERPASNRKPRRSCTLELSKEAMEMKRPYYPMPLWLNGDTVTWAEKATYAVILARRCLIEHIEEEGCAEDREGLSATDISKATGLDLRTVKRALHTLRHKWFLVSSNPHDDDGNSRRLTMRDTLAEKLFPLVVQAMNPPPG